VSKKEVFWELLESHLPDIVVACETWLDQSITNNEVILSGYKIYHRNHDDGYGGVLISVKNTIDSQTVECNTPCEICSVKLHLAEGQPLIIIGIYRPTNRDVSYAQNVFNAITDVTARNRNSFICCTDLPGIDWDTESVSRYRYPLVINYSLLKMFADCFFTQFVNSPTRDRDLFLKTDQCLSIDALLNLE